MHISIDTQEAILMDINALIVLHGNKKFKVDAQDELGGFMQVDGYKIHVRKDDVNLVEGMSISDIHPLIDKLQKESFD